MSLCGGLRGFLDIQKAIIIIVIIEKPFLL
jgi:hypothetical protein